MYQGLCTSICPGNTCEPRDRDILIIDDDQELCALLATYFSTANCILHAVHDPYEGVQHAISGKYALVILDVMLPKMNGFETLHRIRTVSKVPVLMLTACGEDEDRILGLESGADDYLQKPFNPRELLARVNAVMRRSVTLQGIANDVSSRFVFEDLELIASAQSAYRDGILLPLTSVEFLILETLVQHAGQPVSREDMTRTLLGRELLPFDRSIDVHISRLRKKIGPRPDGTERIKAMRGLGYLYAAQ